MTNFRKVFTALMLMLTCALGISAQGYTYKTIPGDPMKARIYTLKNGLTVYLSVNKEKPRIQTYIAVRTGSRNDPAETTGLAHYLEHLMFKGTTHFGTSNLEAETPYLNAIQDKYEYYRTLTDPQERKACYHEIDSLSQLAAQYNIPNEYDKMMANIGAEGSNAYTSNDVTCYEEDIPSNELDNWLKVEGDRFQNMMIRGFHTELEAVYEEYNIGLAKDGNKLYTALMAKLFPTHPYGTQTTIGKGEHLKNPSIVNIKNYFNQYYVPNNVAICMSGDLDPDEVVAKIDRYFGSWKKSESLSYPQFAPLPAITSPIDTTVIGQEAETVYLGWRFPEARSLTKDTLDVISDILNNDKAGLIDLDLNQQMKVQGAFAGAEGLADYSFFVLGGIPKEGQSLKEVRQLLLAELDKLKKGDFDDDLLPAVINNYKRDYYDALDQNQFRANEFVDAFINRTDWKQKVESLDRKEHMTKQQIVDFANRYFNDNYVCVYKEQGNDTTLKKVEKPAITPIPTNNDKHSQFLMDVSNNKPEPIQPRFLDFNKDLTKGKSKKNMPVLYKQNTDNSLFTLQLRYPNLGEETDPTYSYAFDYLDYVGTAKMSNEDFKKQMYKLGCDYSINQSDDELRITLKGLSENMDKALALVNDLIKNGKADEESYNNFVDLTLKQRKNNKTNQQYNYSALFSYACYGQYNGVRNVLSEQTLKSLNGDKLLQRTKDIRNYQPTLLYYGPDDMNSVAKRVDKLQLYKPVKGFQAPEPKPYVKQTTPTNEVILAPYDAKNIYMAQYHNENQQWSPERAPLIRLFNEYFGGPMNAIVFQELREARGLAYSASAYYIEPRKKNNPESFYTFIITQTDKMPDCVNEFNSLLNTLPARDAGLNVARQSVMKSIASNRTTKFSVLSAYWNAQKLGLDYDIEKVVYEKLPSITLQDILNFEKTCMANKTYKYVILGNEKDLDMDFVNKLGTVKRLTTDEIFGY